MKRFVVLVGTLTIVILSWAAPAQAAVITYTTSSIASGTLGGTPFVDALVTVELTGNTSGVTEVDPVALPGLFFNVGTATLSVAGFGTATFNDPNGYLALIFPTGLLPDTGFLPAFFLGEFDNPEHTSFTGILGLFDPGLAGYDLRSPFGPLTAVGQGGATNPFGAPILFPTTAGLFGFTGGQVDLDAVTLTVTVDAVAVPEPASLSLFGLGVAGAIAARRRRRQPRNKLGRQGR